MKTLLTVVLLLWAIFHLESVFSQTQTLITITPNNGIQPVIIMQPSQQEFAIMPMPATIQQETIK